VNSIHAHVQVKVSTEKECALGVSFYPDFAYNAEGGGGTGKVTAMDIDGKVAVSFDPLSLSIPALVRPAPAHSLRRSARPLSCHCHCHRLQRGSMML
jgi:hypothetical protein